MKATQLLTQQHREVDTLFKEIFEGGQRADKAEELANKLLAHMIVEQTVFYPAVAKVAPELIQESFEEHAVGRFEVRRMLDAEEQPRFEARVITLRDIISSHVTEEEKTLFPKVEAAMSAHQLEALGASMEALFNVLVRESFETLLDRSRRTGEDFSRNAATKPQRPKSSPSIGRSRDSMLPA